MEKRLMLPGRGWQRFWRSIGCVRLGASYQYGKARRMWVFDRGIVSEENLAALRKRGARYLVGTVRKMLKEFEREMLEGGWGASATSRRKVANERVVQGKT